MTVFTRGRQATLVAAGLALLSMLSYPGGTTLDHATRRYQPFQNFLSDLGMTVAYDGRANGTGALLFVASLVILVIGLSGCLVGFVRLYSSPRSRPVVRLALVLGGIVALSFLGVAVTPENRVMGLHLAFTLFAFRLFPVVPLLFAIATMRDDRIPPRFAIGWIVLTTTLAAYVVVLGWGPRLATASGLTTQVVAQKLVTVIAIAVLFYQSIEADRLVARRQVIA
jgi:hypothetical protein